MFTGWKRLFGMCFAWLCLLALTANAFGQEVLAESAVNDLERETISLLLEKEVASVSDRLAAEPVTTVLPLLQRLLIYSRAGHTARMHQALKQLAHAPDWQSCQPYAVRRRVRSAIPADDLVAWRLYFESLCPSDVDGAETFLRLWEQQGNADELDEWLAARGDNVEWLRLRIHRLARLGTAERLVNAAAENVRANPRDLERAQRYLLVNNWAGDLQNIAWLADVCEMTTAYENYELGKALQRTAVEAAAHLFTKALALPFTARDSQLVRERVFRFLSMPPAQLNWEKQLRFWIKRGLAETYEAMRRPNDAQPLVEELVAMAGSDIMTQDVHLLAGSVQAASGQRKVETHLMGEEIARRDTASYWLERANYYRGRQENELENETYSKALEALSYQPKSQNASFERLQVVRSFAFSLYQERNSQKDWRLRLGRLLRTEFFRAAPETTYAFAIARLICDDEFELDELRRSLFVKQPELLARVLSARRDWGNEEEIFIEDATRGEEISPEQKDKIWAALEKLVHEPASSRAYRLAEAMSTRGALQRALPLLLGCLKNDKPTDDWDRNAILRQAIEAYCQKGDWQAAEKLLFVHKDWAWQTLSRQLGILSSAAAKRGAIDDSLRLWKLKVNLDRRDLTGLDQLSQTHAKPALRAFYRQMITHDPLTSAPELALKILN